MAETAFTLSGARWVYRTAPGELELVDISGLGSFSLSAAGKVSYCDAQLSYDEGGAGKIIWFDIVPRHRVQPERRYRRERGSAHQHG